MSELTQHDLSALVRDHGPELQHFLTRRLGCADTAKDLVQDTFLRLLQNMPGEILGNPRAFLFRVATNLLIDHHRRQQHRDTVTLDDPERPLDQADQSPSIENRSRRFANKRTAAHTVMTSRVVRRNRMLSKVPRY